MKIEILENFLKEKHLTSLCSLKLDEVKSDELKVYHNQIMDGQVITSSCISEKLLKELHESYHPIAMDILKKINPENLNCMIILSFKLLKPERTLSFLFMMILQINY